VIRVETQKGIYSKGTFVSLEENPGWPGQTLETSDWQRIVVATDISARTPAAEDLVNELRALDASALVGGAAGEYSDSQEGIARQLPWALLWVAVATLILLFLFTGSVLLPIKAVVLNVLSLGATMGVITWMFQNGNLQFLTGDYTVTGTLDTSTLVLIAIVTFGLSMDYEVFLLSRVKEEHDAGSDTTDAVALGLQRSGRIISAAAVLLAVVFAAFVTSSVTSIKMLGFGIAFAILLDATVVRGLLVPALMRIAGRFNWWAPAPLVKLHQRIGLSD
jgi:RND superfamily putative drug exporter